MLFMNSLFYKRILHNLLNLSFAKTIEYPTVTDAVHYLKALPNGDMHNSIVLQDPLTPPGKIHSPIRFIKESMRADNVVSNSTLESVSSSHS
uniref:Uncharacterized protein n=1 Tax=Brugia timori TaxID=42155 RepID=A0A0R3QAU2_9BILA